MSHAEKLEADGPQALAFRMAGYIADPNYIASYVAREYGKHRAPTVEQCKAYRETHERRKAEFRRVSEASCGYNAENDNGEPYKPGAIVTARKRRNKPVLVEVKAIALPIRPPRGLARRIIEMVAAEFGLTVEELRSYSRFRKVVAPRYLAMKLLREQVNENGEPRFTLQQIAGFVGKQDHSTVANGIGLFDVRAKQYPALAEAYERIKGVLG